MHLFRESASPGASEEDEVNFFHEMGKDASANQFTTAAARSESNADPVLMAFTATSFAAPLLSKPAAPPPTVRKEFNNGAGDRTPLRNKQAQAGNPPQQTLQTLPSLPSDCSWMAQPNIEPVLPPVHKPAVSLFPGRRPEAAFQPPLLQLSKPGGAAGVASFALNLQRTTPIGRKEEAADALLRPQLTAHMGTTVNAPQKEEKIQPFLAPRPIIQLGPILTGTAASGMRRDAQPALAAVGLVAGSPLANPAPTPQFSKPQAAPRGRSEEKKVLLDRAAHIKAEIARHTERDRTLRKRMISAALLGQTFDRKLENLINSVKTAPFVQVDD